MSPEPENYVTVLCLNRFVVVFSLILRSCLFVVRSDSKKNKWHSLRRLDLFIKQSAEIKVLYLNKESMYITGIVI